MTARILNTDCVTGMAESLDAESIDLVVSSIPFADLFTYSSKNEDIGNCSAGVDVRESMFGLHCRFMIEQVFRVLKPGSIAGIHIQQLLTYKVQHGYMGRRDFRGAVVDLFVAGGFEWVGEFVIAKNPQAVAQRQQLHSLQFITGRRDARHLAPYVNDYVMLFRKPGDGTPVRSMFEPSLNPGGWVTTEEWIRDACGVWSDIQETDVLSGWKSAREPDDEAHVCPLQLEVIRRLIRLYSNPGDLVLDPFMGIGSVAFVATEQERDAVGFEIKESYHKQALANVALAERRKTEVDLPLLAFLEREQGHGPVTASNGLAADEVAV